MDLATLSLYICLFVSLFFEIFILITFFEVREELERERESIGTDLKHFPTITVIVPCFNEELTVAKTIDSVLALDYPKDKLHIVIVDDGSTDGTEKSLAKYKNHKNIEIFKKENSGKHTALNFALGKTETELVGCLDADSFVSPDALRRIIPLFGDPKTMAVTPAIRIHDPKSVLQYVQRVEYSWGVFLRRVLASMDSLYVTPGPFSIFRTKVFKEVGGYKHAHHTEDMEMALRLQKRGYKIANSHSAFVYTVGPATLKALYKQRVRWTYGFLNNVIDYREMVFNRKYGDIGMFILPIATFSIFSTIYASLNLLWTLLRKIPVHVAKYEAVGFNLGMPRLAVNWFGINTSTVVWITITTVFLSLSILYFALQLTNGKAKFGKDVFFYLTLYIFIVPFWLAKAAYSTILRQPISWK